MSDKRLKKNIKDIDKTLAKLINLKPVKYKLISKKGNNTIIGNESVSGSSTVDIPQVGLIAQEVQELFPEVVSAIDSNYLGIRYTELIPILIKGLQEQQENIEQLKARAEIMENDYSTQNENLKSGSMENPSVNLGLNSARLYPTNPNPIGKPINIRFEIPKSIQNSHLYFCDITGRLLKTEKVDDTGSISIETNELAAGKYLFSLVCDGSIVDTKQMFLTE